MESWVEEKGCGALGVSGDFGTGEIVGMGEMGWGLIDGLVGGAGEGGGGRKVT